MQIQQSQASVGIIVGVREGEREAVLLQVRADHDSYARACQVTTHGKLTDDEIKLDEPMALATALGRKLREELGHVAAEMVEASLSKSVDLERVVNSKGRLVVTVGVDLGLERGDFEKLVVPGKDVAGFRTCVDPSKLQELTDEHKSAGVLPNETRMFRDEIAAVKAFFRKIFQRGDDAGAV